MFLHIFSLLMLMVGAILCAPEGQMMRLAREDKSAHPQSHDNQRSVPGGGHLMGLLDPYAEGQILRSLDREHLLESLDSFKGGEVLRMLDTITGGQLLSTMDSTDGETLVNALRKTHTKHPKRMLDSVSGWAFGESKRNFDEIDNVGFTGFAKRNRWNRNLALAKKNFDEIDRAGFGTYQKKNFDEIDNTGMGFGAYVKRSGKE